VSKIVKVHYFSVKLFIVLSWVGKGQALLVFERGVLALAKTKCAWPSVGFLHWRTTFWLCAVSRRALRI